MRTTLNIMLAAALLFASCAGCASTAPDFGGVVAVRAKLAYGSGVVVDHTVTGYTVATAAHVVKADRYPLIDEHLGGTILVDRLHDLALVLVPDHGQGYRVREMAPAVQGEPVSALGWTYHRNDCARLIYRGHIVTTRWPYMAGTSASDAGSFPGMSGGPVVNARGQVVGIIRGCHRLGAFVVFDSTGVFTPARFVRALME